MGLYSQFLFPCLCDLVLNRPVVAEFRRELLAQVSGSILEIGFGTGLNLPCYPKHVRKITTVDPSRGMSRRARKRIEALGINVELHQVGSEQLPFDDNSFDCVVSTLTLCSIDDVDQAVSEAWRVLKPAGRFLFFEHGISPEPRIQKWQRRLKWLEMQFAGGCRLDRNVREIVARQPFTSIDLQEFYVKGVPKTHGFVYRGIATK